MLEEKKIIPKNLTLNNLICAIWYLDDGTNGYRSNSLTLYTNGFEKKYVEYLVEQLKNLGYDHTYLKKLKIKRLIDRKFQYTITIRRESYRKFLKMVGKTVKPFPECMIRKIDTTKCPRPTINLYK